MTNLLHAYLILLICILNEIYGTRIPLEIVQLESGTRISDDKIVAHEYRLHETDQSHESTKQQHNRIHATDNRDHDEWKNRIRSSRKLTTTSASSVQEPRIFYQVGVSA